MLLVNLVNSAHLLMAKSKSARELGRQPN